MILGERLNKGFNIKEYKDSDNLERNIPDIDLSGIVPGEHKERIKVREAYLMCKRLGRPLTDEELQEFIIKE